MVGMVTASHRALSSQRVCTLDNLHEVSGGDSDGCVWCVVWCVPSRQKEGSAPVPPLPVAATKPNSTKLDHDRAKAPCFDSTEYTM